jgi:hypothetical protein
MNIDVVCGLSGRRIDAPGAPDRFPLDQVPLVRQRLRQLLIAQNVGLLICSAACGADLVSLEEARNLGLRRRIVLPFAIPIFRQESVTDRPGDWGPTFDRLVAEAEAANDLIVLPGSPAEKGIYLRANEAILDEALALAGAPSRATATIVWEGASRGEDDATDFFARSARHRGLTVFEVSTR